MNVYLCACVLFCNVSNTRCFMRLLYAIDVFVCVCMSVCVCRQASSAVTRQIVHALEKGVKTHWAGEREKERQRQR